jgi:hypothetical protein
MVVLIGRENADVADADMAVSWKLQTAVKTVVDEREKADVA